MPFAEEFDDVYGVIKQAVESAASTNDGRCFRLDEARPAGRITDRLLGELRSATLCVADITGAKPNVMWELGFAMALGTPAIVVTQSLADLPFDIRDMQTIEYRRSHLAASLGAPLRRVLLDTLAGLEISKFASEASAQQSEAVGSLRGEVAELKKIVAEVVKVWNGPGTERAEASAELQSMTGHWLNVESGSHAYTRVIRDELVTPYCFMSNEALTGIYFGWRRTGDYWFARYRWLTADISGFSFLKRDSVDSLIGAWWSSEHEAHNSESPPRLAGIPAKWVRVKDKDVPIWADEAFKEVEREGLASYFAKIDAT